MKSPFDGVLMLAVIVVGLILIATGVQVWRIERHFRWHRDRAKAAEWLLSGK